MQPGASRKRLWKGFWIMCAAVVAWVMTFRLAVNPIVGMPHYRSGMTSAEIQEQQRQLDEAMERPIRMVNWMAAGHVVAGILFVAGLMTTGMGLVEYSAELRGGARG